MSQVITIPTPHSSTTIASNLLDSINKQAIANRVGDSYAPPFPSSTTIETFTNICNAFALSGYITLLLILFLAISRKYYK